MSYQKAIVIATVKHNKQVDKSGEPYIKHVIRVSQMGQTEDEKIVGLLHDVVEDTGYTLDELSEDGFSDKVIEAVDALTRKEGQSYTEFINTVIETSELAARVKLNDLLDNMDVTRLKKLKNNDLDRINKYLKSYHRIKNHFGW